MIRYYSFDFLYSVMRAYYESLDWIPVKSGMMEINTRESGICILETPDSGIWKKISEKLPKAPVFGSDKLFYVYRIPESGLQVSNSGTDLDTVFEYYKQKINLKLRFGIVRFPDSESGWRITPDSVDDIPKLPDFIIDLFSRVQNPGINPGSGIGEITKWRNLKFGSVFDYNSYFWDDFTQEFLGKEFPEPDAFLIKLSRVLVRIDFPSPIYLVKFRTGPEIKSLNYFSGTISRKEPVNRLFRGKIITELRIRNIRLSELLLEFSDSISWFHDLVFSPGFRNLNPVRYVFNLWPGLRIENRFSESGNFLDHVKNKIRNFNFNKIFPVLDFMNRILCSGNKSVKNYLDSWIYRLLFGTEIGMGLCIHVSDSNLISGFTGFLIHVLGEYLCSEVSGISKVSESQIIGKKLVIVSDFGNTPGKFKSGFLKMKHFISDSELNLESAKLNNLAGFIIITDQPESVLRGSDARIIHFSPDSNSDSCPNLTWLDPSIEEDFYIYYMMFSPRDLVDIFKKPEKTGVITDSGISEFLSRNTENPVRVVEFYEKYKQYCRNTGIGIKGPGEFKSGILEFAKLKRINSYQYYEFQT